MVVGFTGGSAAASAGEIETKYDYAASEGPPAVQTPELTADAPMHRSTAHTVFVNFDGVDLIESSWDYAPNNETQFPGAGGAYPPFGEPEGGQARTAILESSRADFEPFDVLVTDERPDSTAYTMVVVSPRGAAPGKLGYAGVHCGGSNLNGIGFAFYTLGDGSPPIKVASTVSHEAAHTFGLEHVALAGDLMHSIYQNVDALFVDECAPLDGPSYCAANHATHCAAAGQNGHQELLDLFGTGTPDAVGPDVVIVEPQSGDRFAPGEVIEVIVDATDNVQIGQVKLFRGDDLVGTELDEPYDWTLAALDDGVYELHAQAIDGAGNETVSDIVTFAVGDAELPGSETGDPGTDSDWGDDGPMFGEDRADAGCGCRSPEPPGPTPWRSSLVLVLFTAAAAATRRSRSPCRRTD